VREADGWAADAARRNAVLSDPLVLRVLDPDHLERLRAGTLPSVTAPYGSVSCYLPGEGPLRHRLLELDRRGRVTLVIRRGPAGEFLAAWMPGTEGSVVGVLPGHADHPLWGASDRIVRNGELLTVCGRVAWDRVGYIPALADPTRLPPGGGTAILTLLAGLAADQGAGQLRYRGPYATEQLFWNLVDAFRFDPAGTDPLGRFLDGAEQAFLAGAVREAPLDWTPAPPERLFLEDGIAVQLRDGVEKVSWNGRTYQRADCQGLERREPRVVRRVAGPDGSPRFVASLVALGSPLEDHLVLDAAGNLLERPPAAPLAPEADVPLGPLWRDALAALLPLEATPLLAPAIASVWPSIDLVWGPVARDLVETRGEGLRVALALARAFAARRAPLDLAARRDLTRTLVRDLLGLVGPPVRTAAARWLAAQSPARQTALLEAASQADRQAAAVRAAEALGPLLDALAAGEGVPGPPA
jgi:hypothetical protein